MTSLDCSLLIQSDQRVLDALAVHLTVKEIVPFLFQNLSATDADVQLVLGPSTLAVQRLRALVITTDAPAGVKMIIAGALYPLAAGGVFFLLNYAGVAGNLPYVRNTTSTKATFTGFLAGE